MNAWPGPSSRLRELPANAKYDLALRIYDLMQYRELRLRRRYMELPAQASIAATVPATTMPPPSPPSGTWPRSFSSRTNLRRLPADPLREEAARHRQVRHGPLQRRPHHLSPSHQSRIQHRQACASASASPPDRLASPPGAAHEMVAPTARLAPAGNRVPRLVHSLLDRVSLHTDEAYGKALRILRCPEGVSGYREVRYPKMDAVRSEVEGELHPPTKLDVTSGVAVTGMPARRTDCG